MEKNQFDTLMLAITGLDAKFTTAIADLKTEMNTKFDKIEVRLDKIEVRLDGIDTRLDKIEVRLDGVDTRLDKIEVRLDGIDTRLAVMDKKIDLIAIQTSSTVTHVSNHERRIKKLEGPSV
jgi:archaellum component FlaC